MGFTTEQQQAIEARGTSISVSAAAGSGKTTVMTRRIVERVCQGGDITRILAVTFTRAAAAQIQSGISRKMSEMLALDPSNSHIARQSLLVGAAKISTIHSFCLEVIRDNYSNLALPSDFAPADATALDVLSKKIMDELIEDYFDKRIVGECAIDDFPLFADSFGSVKKLDTLGENLIEVYEKLSCKVKFLDSIDDYIQMYKNVDADDFFSSGAGIELKRHTVDILEYYARIMRDFYEYITVNPNYNSYASAINLVKYELDYLESALGAVKSGRDYFEVAKLLYTFDPPAKQLSFGKNLPADAKYEFFKNERTSFRGKFVGTPAKPSTFVSVFYDFSKDDLCRYAKMSADLLCDLKRFLCEFDRRFKAEKIRRHAISFSDMEHFTLDILWDRENDCPSAEARRISDGLDEIYVDEYQDTNEVQDKIFSLISREDNRFCVGDVKQSIYAFRGAQPDIFNRMLGAADQYTPSYSGKNAKIFLSKNFRSSEQIITFCNSVFEVVMNAGEQMYSASERLNAAQGKSAMGDVEVAAFSGEDYKQKEAEYVARRISEYVSSGINPGDIAILLRSSTRAPEFEDALKKYGISCKNTMDKRFFEFPEVLTVVSLLSAIDNPSRDVYVAAALKSPLFGATLDELIHIRKSAPGSLYDAVCDFTEKTGLKKGREFISFIEKYRALSMSLSCDKLIRKIYLDTDVLSISVGQSDMEKEAARANLIALYDYSIAFARGEYKTLYDFITLLWDAIDGKKKISVGGAQSAAVQLSTIHNSKGLEYKICFVSAAASTFSGMDLKKKILISDSMMAMRIADGSGVGQVMTPYCEIARIPIQRQRQNEEMRLLYVALTRAKEKLIVTSASKGEPDFSDGGENAAQRAYASPYMLYQITNYINSIAIGCAGKGTCVFESNPDPSDSAPTLAYDEGDDEMTLVEARRLVSERLSFKYPYGALVDMPSKTAVSDLFPGMLDDDGAARDNDDEESFSHVPRFISEQDDESASRRGTATHTFMQFFDFDRVKNHGVNGEIRYLVEQKFLFCDDAELIDKRALEKFFSSPLAQKMRNAKRIFREKRFIIGLDASLFTDDDELKKSLDGEEMLVQGVIDCAFEDEDGKITVVDYKTDHFKRGTPRDEIEKTLISRHSRQLGYYREACRAMFGEVRHVYVYSFAIGDTVEIFGGCDE